MPATPNAKEGRFINPRLCGDRRGFINPTWTRDESKGRGVSSSCTEVREAAELRMPFIMILVTNWVEIRDLGIFLPGVAQFFALWIFAEGSQSPMNSPGWAHR